MPIRGANQVKYKLRTTLGDERRAERAVTAATVVAQGIATLMTPVDTGNLRNSQYRIVRFIGYSWRGTVGYTANYAAAVHEMPGTLKGQPRAHFGRAAEGVEFGGGTGVGNYWDPFGEPQFLKKAFDYPENRAIIHDTVLKAMKL